MQKLAKAILIIQFFSGITAFASPKSTVTVDEIYHYADKDLDFQDPKLLASIAKIESNYHFRAVNIYKGTIYYGLMQISYQTARAVGFKGHPKDLMNWKINLKYAAKYLELLIPKHITLRRVIASYNAGTVYLCRKRCPPGQFVNEGYVTSVMEVYTSLKNVATE